MESFELPVSLRIKRPIELVYNAWLDPQIAKEWLCDEMGGRWRTGESVFWHFGMHKQELKVIEVVPNRSLRFQWNAAGSRPETEVQIIFQQFGDETGVKLLEKQWPLTVESVRNALDAAYGWENVLCRLKAWLEAGTKLR